MEYFYDLNEVKKTSPEKRKIIFIPENVYKDVPVKDNGERLVNFKKFCRENNLPIIISLVWEREDIRGCFFRESVADKLREAYEKLRHLHGEYTFFITDAYRPIGLQRELFIKIRGTIRRRYPELSESDLYNEVTKYVADPDNKPPHSTGGAVDLTIYDRKKKKEIAMGTKIDEISDFSETFSTRIASEHKNNRFLLYRVMTDAGFVNAPSEWWHYSYGDQYWAAFYGTESIYTPV